MSTIEALKQKLSSRSNVLQRQVGARDEVVERIAKKKRQFQELNEHLKIVEKSQTFVENAIRLTREDVVKGIQTVVNEALEAVYEDRAPKLECEIGVKRDKSAIIPRFSQLTRAGFEVKRDTSGWGFGVSDVTSLMLRMVLIKASGAEPILIADEPLKHLGTLAPRAAKLLKTLSHRLGVQVIMTTHQQEVVDVADVVFRVQLDENKHETTVLREEN